MASRALVLLQNRSGSYYLPADLVRAFLHRPTLTALEDTGLHMTLVEGQVVPVVILGEPSDTLVVCESDVGWVGFSGFEVERVAHFELGAQALGALPERFIRFDIAQQLDQVHARLAQRLFPPHPAVPV